MALCINVPIYLNQLTEHFAVEHLGHHAGLVLLLSGPMVEVHGGAGGARVHHDAVLTGEAVAVSQGYSTNKNTTTSYVVHFKALS